MKFSEAPLIVLAAVLLVVVCAPGCEQRSADKPQTQARPHQQAQPQPPMKPLLDPPLKWVDLMSFAMIDWSQKARSAAAGVCRTPRMTPEQHSACIREALPEETRKRTEVIPLREGPSNESRQIGEIVITAEVYTPCTIQYRAADGSLVRFEPDDVLEYSDSSSFLHTVLEQQGAWVLLPKRPFPREVWIDAAGRSIQDPLDNVYEWAGQSIVILGKQGGGVRVRPEQPSDNTCEGKEPPTPEDQIRKFDIPWPELYDAEHHLLLKRKYTIC